MVIAGYLASRVFYIESWYDIVIMHAWLQFRHNSLDATLILAVILLFRGDLLPLLRTVVSIIMQECISIMVGDASSA